MVLWYGVPFIGDKWKVPGFCYIFGNGAIDWTILCMWVLSLDFCTENRNRLGKEWEDEKCYFPEKLETTIKTSRCGHEGPDVRVWSAEAESWGSSAQRL